MIVIRYLVREVLKSQLAILFILLLIFSCQRLVRILGVTVDDDIPVNLALSLLGLGMPEMAQFTLSPGLFLELLMTLGKLYTKSEVTAMHVCDLNKAVLVKAAMIPAVFTAIVAVANVMWAGPWSSRHQDEVLIEVRANPDMAALMQGQFQQVTNGSSVLFVESIDDNDFKDTFLAQIRLKGNARPSVVAADFGHLTQLRDGFQVVTLNQGMYFEGAAPLHDFRITDFQDCQAIIGHQAVALDPNDTDQMDTRTLWNTDTDRARAELNWCIMLVFTVFMMALMVVLLSVVSPCRGRILSILPVMLLYLLFFLIQTLLKSNGGKDKLDSMLWMWIVNLVYPALAIILNLWDTVPVCYLCASFSRKGAM